MEDKDELGFEIFNQILDMVHSFKIEGAIKKLTIEELNALNKLLNK